MLMHIPFFFFPVKQRNCTVRSFANFLRNQFFSGKQEQFTIQNFIIMF